MSGLPSPHQARSQMRRGPGRCLRQTTRGQSGLGDTSASASHSPTFPWTRPPGRCQSVACPGNGGDAERDIEQVGQNAIYTCPLPTGSSFLRVATGLHCRRWPYDVAGSRTARPLSDGFNRPLVNSTRYVFTVEMLVPRRQDTLLLAPNLPTPQEQCPFRSASRSEVRR